MEQISDNNNTINILIVEDDYMSYFLIKEYLNPFGFHFYRAINDSETWELLHSNNKFHLILMDVRLSCEINGIDLSREIKKIFPDLPIMIQTAIVSSLKQKNSILGIYDDFIIKPYSMDNFTNKVLSLLNYVIV